MSIRPSEENAIPWKDSVTGLVSVMRLAARSTIRISCGP